jgi:hypothetical protein
VFKYHRDCVLNDTCNMFSDHVCPCKHILVCSKEFYISFLFLFPEHLVPKLTFLGFSFVPRLITSCPKVELLFYIR